MLGRKRIERSTDYLVREIIHAPQHVGIILPFHGRGIGESGNVFANHEGIVIRLFEFDCLRFRRTSDKLLDQLKKIFRHIDPFSTRNPFQLTPV